MRIWPALLGCAVAGDFTCQALAPDEQIHKEIVAASRVYEVCDFGNKAHIVHRAAVLPTRSIFAEPGRDPSERPDLLNGVVTVSAKCRGNETELTCIPYYAWCHRGPNEMRVWFPAKF